MKYSILATSLVLALGGHHALAQSADDPSAGSKTSSGEKKTTEAKAETKTVEATDVLFDTDSAQLRADADAKLKDLADWAACNPKGVLILEGHADPRGAQAYNMELSAKRAASVRQKLADMGVPSNRIVISVYGENGPRKANFQEDRRVSIRPAETPVEAHDISAMR